MRALAELVVIVSGALTIAKFGIDWAMRKHARRREENVDAVRRLEGENREIDEAISKINQGGSKWPGSY